MADASPTTATPTATKRVTKQPSEGKFAKIKERQQKLEYRKLNEFSKSKYGRLLFPLYAFLGGLFLVLGAIYFAIWGLTPNDQQYVTVFGLSFIQWSSVDNDWTIASLLDRCIKFYLVVGILLIIVGIANCCTCALMWPFRLDEIVEQQQSTTKGTKRSSMFLIFELAKQYDIYVWNRLLVSIIFAVDTFIWLVYFGIIDIISLLFLSLLPILAIGAYTLYEILQLEQKQQSTSSSTLSGGIIVTWRFITMLLVILAIGIVYGVGLALWINLMAQQSGQVYWIAHVMFALKLIGLVIYLVIAAIQSFGARQGHIFFEDRGWLVVGSIALIIDIILIVIAGFFNLYYTKNCQQ